MTAATLTPNATGPGSWDSITGAADVDEALASIGDDSYVTWAAMGSVEVDLTDSAMPSTARVKWLRAVTRRQTTNASNNLLTVVGNNGGERRTLLSSLNTEAASFTAAAGGYTTGTGIPVTADDVAAYKIELEARNVHASYAAIELVYVEQPVVTVAAIDPDPFTGSGPTVSWANTLDADGGNPTRYRHRTFTAAQVAAEGFDPATSDAYLDSGEVLGANTSAALGPLENGTYRVYVAVAQTVGGSFWSEYDFDEFTITGDAAEVDSVNVTSDAAAARLRIQVNRDTGGFEWDQVDVERSIDAGVTWAAVRGATYGAASGDTFTVDDYEIGNGVPALYRARALRDGTSGPIIGAWTEAAAAVAWTSTASWLKVPDDPTRNIIITEDDPYAPQVRPIPNGVHRVLGRRVPVVIADVMGAPSSTLSLLTSTAEDIRTLLDTLEHIVLLYHPAPGMNIGDATTGAQYLAVLGVTEAWRAEGNPNLRKWDITYTEVEVPDGVVLFNPSAPTAVQISRTATVGELVLSWEPPAFGVAASYEVEADESEGLDGTWEPVADVISPSSYTWSEQPGDRQMRVRSVGENGSKSEWVTKVLDPTWDATPPDEVTMTSWKPETTYGRLVVRFTTAATDNDEYQVQYRVNGGSWTTTTDWASVGNSEDVDHHVVTGTAGNEYEVRVNVRDATENTRTGTGYAYTLKAAAQTLNATGTTHYRSGTWNWAGNGKVYQGYFSDPGTNYTGLIFYGATGVEDACAADSDLGGTLTISSIQVRLTRSTPQGNFSVSTWLGTSVTTAAGGGAPSVQNVSNMGALLNTGAAETFTLTTAQRDALIAGTARSLGLFRNNSDGYMAVNALADDALVGRLTINSLG